MEPNNLPISTNPIRSAGWSAIASGICGLLSIAALVAYLTSRSPDPETGILMNRLHDGGVILQFLFMIPVAFALNKLSQKTYNASQNTLFVGIGAIGFVILCLILIFPKVVSDILYMVPQGIFGAWLIFTNLRIAKVLSKGIRWFGIVVGTGLMLVGLFPLGFVIFVDFSPFEIPAAASQDFPQTLANSILHQILFTGTILGVLTLPIWTLIVGFKFFGLKRNAVIL